MSTREQNERKFPNWIDMPNGGRRARYVKEVDANEETIAFFQEIYDETDTLVEVHHKFPQDTGHQKMR